MDNEKKITCASDLYSKDERDFDSFYGEQLAEALDDNISADTFIEYND